MKNTFPELTAYALGELNEVEKEVLFKKLKEEGFSDVEIEKEIEKIQKTQTTLKEEFRKDEMIRLTPYQRESLFPKKGFNLKKIILGFGVTGFATVAIFLSVKPDLYNKQVINEVSVVKEDKVSEIHKESKGVKKAPVFETLKVKSGGGFAGRDIVKKSKGNMGVAESMVSAPSMVTDQSFRFPVREEFNREGYDKVDTNPYVLVSNQPLSTFSVDVDTASYSNMRRFLLKGKLPPKDSIRVEELINYFHYNYEMNFEKHPVAVRVDQSISPWNKNRKLVRVALKTSVPKNLEQVNKNLVFLLDISGSMNSVKKLPLLKESIQLLVRKLKPEDTVSIVVYAGASGVVLDGAKASEKLKIFQALDNLSAGGSTNAGQGIIAAYKLAKQNFIKGGVNRVILATDGDFNVGASSRSAMLNLIEEKSRDDIYLTVVGLGMGNYQDAMLEEISNRGNGNYAYIDSFQEANKLFNVDLEKNLTTVAKDVKVQIEFNPNKVQAYRLIGYENRMLKTQDFNNDKKDAGEMGAGHNVTALYEIILPTEKIEIPKQDKLKYQKQVKSSNNTKDVLTVKVRYKEPTEDKSKKFEVVLNDKVSQFESMDKDFRFATSVASFGMKLRGDSLVKNMTYRDLIRMSKESKGSDKLGFRSELIELIDLAKQIDR